jgi:hydroxymethylpyrimidine pyrophosphatase-like HAD family hydrolase
MIKLVALDLDGTLLGPGFKLSDADKEAIGDARRAGVHVTIDTTRWYELAVLTARRLELTSPLVCHNGAHIRAVDGEAILHLKIPTEPVREIAAFCDERGWESYTSIDGVTYMRTRYEATLDPARLPPGMRLEKLHAPFVTGPATGILAFGEDAIELIPKTFDSKYEGMLAFPAGWSESLTPYVTVTVAGVDKGTGLRVVCEHLGIAPDEAMAVGDAHPDVAMFEVAGIGVAMGNAQDEVKALADAVAPANDAGGVAWAIRRFVLEEG